MRLLVHCYPGAHCLPATANQKISIAGPESSAVLRLSSVTATHEPAERHCSNSHAFT